MLQHYLTAHEQILTESAIFVSLLHSLLPENLLSEFIVVSLQLILCHMAAVKQTENELI